MPSPSHSSRLRWAGHVARMGEERGLYRVMVGKADGKRPMGRPRRRWVDNIRMHLQEVEVCVLIRKVNQSHYRPEVPRGFQEVKVPRLRDNGQDDVKVVSLTHRPPLPPGNVPGTHFR